MKTRFIEATQSAEDGFNHGKFMVGLFNDEEWSRPTMLDQGLPSRLLPRCGWSTSHAFVLDLQTGEGAILLPGGSARADLMKHQVWVCPMFEPFLEWLYDRVNSDRASWFATLPSLIELPDAPPDMQGWRRPGT